MKILMPLLLSATTLMCADTLVLKNGQHIDGTYLGGDARTVKFDAADHITAYPVSDVDDVRFSSGASQTGATSLPLTPAAPPPRPAVQIMTNTPITIRLIDPIRSDDAAPGSIYRASVDIPIYSGGRVVIPAYSSAVVQLLDKTDSGHMTGKTSLTLALTRIEIAGKPYTVQTTDAVQASNNRAGSSAKLTGGTAAAGALLGALAGGGRGAAIGAGSGAAVGAAASVLRPGQKVNLSAETKLTFRLAAPLTLPIQ
ncbi:MAG: hypothetical protein M3Y72_00495 [Acidobacteriota bacterium]|nr:hypothetical protein [Acidobacteriota bacterium]